jgi:RNA polymerase sigma factor (sigma-70 family)
MDRWSVTGRCSVRFSLPRKRRIPSSVQVRGSTSAWRLASSGTDVTFCRETAPLLLMGGTIAVVRSNEGVEAVYRADAERLWRAIYAFAGDAEIASDAVAEAYAQVLTRGAEVRDPAAWTWRTAFRISAGALKAREVRGQAPIAIDEHLDTYGDPDLLAALRRLPEAQRAAVILFYYADLPIRDIADRLGSNSLAVRANLSRGRGRLRQLLGDQDG